MLKVMFAVTCIKDGLRGLFCANQGRNHFHNKPDAEKYLKAITNNNSKDVLDGIGTDLRIDPVFCYDHGDAIDVWFDEKPAMTAGAMNSLVKWVNRNVKTEDQIGVVISIERYIAENDIDANYRDWDTLKEASRQVRIKGESE